MSLFSGIRYPQDNSVGEVKKALNDVLAKLNTVVGVPGPMPKGNLYTVTNNGYQIKDTDGYSIILVPMSANNQTVTLPASSRNVGRLITIWTTLIGSALGSYGTLTVSPKQGSPDTISGAASVTAIDPWIELTFFSNGSTWMMAQTSNNLVLLLAGSTLIGAIKYNGTTQLEGALDGGATNPTHSDRLNYDGALWASSFHLVNGYVDIRTDPSTGGILFQSAAGVARFYLRTVTAETGVGDTGSNMTLLNRHDDGTAIGTVFTITRATGALNWNAVITANSFVGPLTGNADTASKWATARSLAGNSVDGSGNVTFANKFVVQGTADTGLSAAQFLGALGTGIVKNTITTGILSIAVAGDFPTLNQDTTGKAAKWASSVTINATGAATGSVAFDGSSSPVTLALTHADNQNFSAYSAGTVYTFTASQAQIAFGTTSPAITITTAGTYLIQGYVTGHYTGATFAAVRAFTVKMRRTNNTAADLTNSTHAIDLQIVTTLTYSAPPISWAVVYTTANANDIIQLWGAIAVLPTAGSFTCTEAYILATRLY